MDLDETWRWGWGLKIPSRACFQRNHTMGFGQSAKKWVTEALVFCHMNHTPGADSGGMRLHPLLTGCIFVTFNFCPIIWIFGHRLIPCVAAWVQKTKTLSIKHWACLNDWGWHWQVIAACTRSEPWDSYLESSKAAGGPGRTLKLCSLVSPAGSATELTYLQRHLKNTTSRLWITSWATCKSVSQTTTVQSIACRQSFLHSSTSMHSMLCYRRWKCIRRSSTTVTTSYEPTLSCGSNAGMLQRNHRRLHWMHTQHAMHPCIQTYPSCCRCSSLYPSPSATAERFFSTVKRLKTYLRSSMGDEWLTSLVLIHVHAQTTRQLNLSKSLTSSLWLDDTSLISCARLSCFCRVAYFFMLKFSVILSCEFSKMSLASGGFVPRPHWGLPSPRHHSASPLWKSWIRHCHAPLLPLFLDLGSISTKLPTNTCPGGVSWHMVSYSRKVSIKGSNFPKNLLF